MRNSVIKSVLDTDLYKLTMQNAVMQHFPDVKVRYKFIDRNDMVWPNGFALEVIHEVWNMKEMMISDEEYEYLKTLKFLPAAYVDYLKSYRFDPAQLTVKQDDDGRLSIDIEGYWYQTILWEVPLMALISELYFKFMKEEEYVDIWTDEIKLGNQKKAELMVKHNAYFADFGTRRRYSYDNQERVIRDMMTHGKHCFVGTSNVFLAMMYDIKPIGTMAHEWFMGISSMFGYKMANQLALKKWTDTYQGDLGIALSDTFTTDVFFRTFDKKASKLFDGVRHDSGDPFEFADKVVNHYTKLGIDPMSKVIVFSDGLDTDLAAEIKEYCAGKIKSSFGIGTNLTNDVGVKPLNMVIKLSEVYVDSVGWTPSVKLSDDEGKHTGDKFEVGLCKGMLKIGPVPSYEFVPSATL